MADDTTQGPDRVAAVVARVARAWRNTPKPYPVQPRSVMDDLVRALDAAGLLLTAARRERIVDVLCATPCDARCNPTVAGHSGVCQKRNALLRELAGDGGAPASEPVCSGCGAWAKDCFCTPTPAPRRMAGNPAKWADRLHRAEHDENALCADDPPCQPVAAAGSLDDDPTARALSPCVWATGCGTTLRSPSGVVLGPAPRCWGCKRADAIARALATARAEEREACAQVADGAVACGEGRNSFAAGYRTAGRAIAAAIRARGEGA